MCTLMRFWFVFEGLGKPSALSLGCGVTAIDKEDAIELIRCHVFNGSIVPRISVCIENIDVSTLDKRHVLPNMGSVLKRGVWFPLGYE